MYFAVKLYLFILQSEAGKRRYYNICRPKNGVWYITGFDITGFYVRYYGTKTDCKQFTRKCIKLIQGLKRKEELTLLVVNALTKTL